MLVEIRVDGLTDAMAGATLAIMLARVPKVMDVIVLRRFGALWAL